MCRQMKYNCLSILVGFKNALCILLVSIFTIFINGCGSSNEMDEPSFVNRRFTYNAACQSDTLHLNACAKWRVESVTPWITLSNIEGDGDILIPIYIQENNDGAMRDGTIRLYIDNQQPVEIQISQNPDENNGAPLVNLPKSFGLGWGYDLKENYADVSGVRGQVFDAVSLINDWGDDAISTDIHTVTNMFFVKGQSSETLQKEISGKVTGNANLLVASATVSVEYRKQITEQKERLYVWCRDIRGVKTAYFDNDIDVLDPDVIKWCTTYSFQLSVRNDSPQEIVRKFGSHFIIQSCLGGKLDYYFTVSTDLTTEVEKVITAINAKILCFKTSHTWVDEKVWTDVQRDFQGNFKVSGGGLTGDRLNNELQHYASMGLPMTDDSLFEQWYDCFKYANKVSDGNLAMVDFEVIPIWYIVDGLNPEKAEAVEDYVLHQYLR